MIENTFEPNEKKKHQLNKESPIISQQISSQTYTKRCVAHLLEDVMYDPIQVLDHGFIRVIDYMGTDDSIVQAARVSYGRGTKKASEDRDLIRYLMRHRHTSPFEMCEIKLHVKLPIFVARQWLRHRTANINEYSARYSILDKEFYLPKIEHVSAQSNNNKQGRGRALKDEDAIAVLDILRNDAERCYEHYTDMLNDKDLARELARMNLNINFYTQMYWKIDSHNLMHFLSLRCHPHAQYEIRAYANIILDIVKKWMPITYEAFMDYKMHAITLSAQAKNVIAKMIRGEGVAYESSGMTIREWEDMCNAFEVRSS